jgi:hypothetical protein
MRCVVTLRHLKRQSASRTVPPRTPLLLSAASLSVSGVRAVRAKAQTCTYELTGTCGGCERRPATRCDTAAVGRPRPTPVQIVPGEARDPRPAAQRPQSVASSSPPPASHHCRSWTCRCPLWSTTLGARWSRLPTAFGLIVSSVFYRRGATGIDEHGYITKWAHECTVRRRW